MSVLSLYSFSPILRPLPPSVPISDKVSNFTVNSTIAERGVIRNQRNSSKLAVPSARSNKKSNKKSPGRNVSPYDSDWEEEEEAEEDDGFLFPGDNWLMDDGFAEVAEYDVNGKSFKSQNDSKTEDEKRLGSSTSESSVVTPEDQLGGTTGRKSRVGNSRTSQKRSGSAKPISKTSTKDKYEQMSYEIGFDKRWIPLLDYLGSFGLKESHFIQMYERHAAALQTNLRSAQERLEYLLSVGVKQRDIKRILLRQPQILEYRVDNNLKSHVEFLRDLGIPNSKIGQIIATSPSFFSYSVENSLNPTVRYLIEEVGIKEKELGKVVGLSPQILVQRIDISWNTRYMFLSQELGAPRESVLKMVTKHPQLLHYSIDDGFLPRINFLRSIGMSDKDILKVLTNLTQVLSLSLEENLKPKYKYLINDLNNEVDSLTKYPVYFSLSLNQRIRPRHHFLVSLKKAPEGPFPLRSLVPTDESFCQQWAETSVDEYLNFRKSFLLNELAKKYGKNRQSGMPISLY